MVKLPSSPVQIFDPARIRHNRNRYANKLPAHGFLIDWAATQLLDRLGDIKRTFPKALQIGLRTAPDYSKRLQDASGAETLFQMDCAPKLTKNSSHTILAEEEFLPIASDALDLIVNIFNLHHINDLPGSLLQINRSLKPDGLFLGAMLGGESLHELRTILTQTEMEVKGGLSPRIYPFAEKQDMGALLQRAGFALPVIDSDIVRVTYDNLFKLLEDIRGMGESNTLLARDKRPPGKEFFMKAAQHYANKFSEEDGKIVASFEVIFLIGWAPHQSQQKPLKPGSAEYKLADVL